MVEILRQEQHMAEKGIYCPNCGQKDTIEFWKTSGSSVDLIGRKLNNTVRIKPTCRNCKKVFSKGTMFPKYR